LYQLNKIGKGKIFILECPIILKGEMTLSKKQSVESLIRKHKTLTREDVQKKFKEQEEMKKKYTMDAVKLEKNFEKFNNILDPIVNPANDEPLCWVRRPTQEELEEMIPDELMKYRNSPEEVPETILKENEDMLFEMMEKLIAVPEHTAEEWKKRSNLVFQRLFNLHLEQVLLDLGIGVRNF